MVKYTVISRTLIGDLGLHAFYINNNHLLYGNNATAALDEDRLSSLPLELIIQILSRVDTKLAIQTCLLLFPRWKLIWTLMPCLNFSSNGFKTLPKFSEFVTHVLSHRNHQVEVSSVNLYIHGADTENFMREITNYTISHNVQELILDVRPKNEFPSYLFRSQTLKHLTLRTSSFGPCLTPRTPWDFPALTTLYLKDIWLCDDECKSLDLFSNCVNLRNFTLELVIVKAKVFKINTPRLANLTLVNYRGYNVIKVIAHQLENLTIIECSINDLKIPSGLSSFCYKGYYPPHWFRNSYFSVNKVSVSLRLYGSKRHEDAFRIINMLQDLCSSVRFLTLNLDIVECISSFPELLSAQPSPFRNLISLNINSGSRDTCKFEMSTEARNFFFEYSPNATFFMKVPTPSTSTQVSNQMPRRVNHLRS
ncbi:putative F-box/FBD/LRR-repeat protein At4g03220 [Rutidosis leptorrhynchoides]|uniref:putative F-box/FBD/LRR-repeat protein At4g03220 n=1 Tax=Rutidosis leptorrhynchoides TaxID=125765 RepID=UPI003A98EB57